MKRSELTIMPEYFNKYIELCDDVSIVQAVQTSLDELNTFPLEKWKAIGDRVYQPGKWTIRDILQHLVDTERIFSYRALAFARGERKPIPSFEEDEYAREAEATRRTIEDLVGELAVSHQSVKYLFQSFDTTMLNRTGKGFKGDYSVANIGFILPGHQRWHLRIINEKYLPLVNQ